MTTQAPCARCGEMFEQRHRWHRYCGAWCQAAACDAIMGISNRYTPVTDDTIGIAIATPKGGEGQS